MARTTASKMTKPARKPGRPTKLTPELQRRICTLIRKGLPRERAARLAGIGERTFHTWMAEGEHQEEGPFQQFRQAVCKAEDALVQRAVSTVHDLLGPKNEPSTRLNAAKFILSHRFPGEFSTRQEVTGAKGAPVQIRAQTTEVPFLSDEQLRTATPEQLEALEALFGGFASRT